MLLPNGQQILFRRPKAPGMRKSVLVSDLSKKLVSQMSIDTTMKLGDFIDRQIAFKKALVNLSQKVLCPEVGYPIRGGCHINWGNS